MSTYSGTDYDCIRCGEAPAVDEQGYCGHCHWAVRAEIEEGMYQLREYLTIWARYDGWCREHGIDPDQGKSTPALRPRVFAGCLMPRPRPL